MERPSPGRRATTEPTHEVESLVSRSQRFDAVSFGAVLEASEGPRISWATPDDLEIVGCGEIARLTANGPNRFRRIRELADGVFDALSHRGPVVARPRAFGGFSFHDDGSDADDGVWHGFDAAAFRIPRIQLTRRADETWLTVTGRPGEADELERWLERLDKLPNVWSAGDVPGTVATSRTTDSDEWTGQVERSLERIAAGELQKVVMAQALTAELASPIDIAATLERLRRRYPNCYRFAFDGAADTTFFGAPPERLVAKRDETLETEALAGSVPRAEKRTADEAHAAHLRESDRLAREHEVVVDAIRRRLGSLAESVRVGDRTVRRLATIQHLLTPVTADLDGTRHVLEIVEALHPTPAVGGAPQEPACEAIRTIESFDRGWYASPVGWFDGDGDGEFTVGIRSGVADERAVSLFAGNGIVADSDPAEEWTEVELKFRPILDELR